MMKIKISKMWDLTKAVFMGTFIALNIYNRKEKMSQINNLRFRNNDNKVSLK